MQRRDVMGWTTNLYKRMDVEALGIGEAFDVSVDGAFRGAYRLDRELCALRRIRDAAVIPVTPERMAALVALDATATRTRDVEAALPFGALLTDGQRQQALEAVDGMIARWKEKHQ